jgi:hypothetical protein
MHKLTPYDPANALVDDEEIAVFIADALETGDSRILLKPWASSRERKECRPFHSKLAYHESSCIDRSVIKETQRLKPLWRS